MDAKEKSRLTFTIAGVFSPGAPIDRQNLFAGRVVQVQKVLNTIMQRGQHVIIYGERGVGKTSLANVISDFFSETGFEEHFASAIVNCDGTDTFSKLWGKIFREMTFSVERKEMGYNPSTSAEHYLLSEFLPDEAVPDDIRHILQRIAQKPSYIIIDELDRIQDQSTTTLLADTIKNLSDHSVNSTLIFLGVADSVDELIVEHKSIERSLVQIRMPRMSRDELREILDKGLGQADMTITQEAKSRITALSQGLPHYTHLLGLHSAHVAIAQGRTKVNESDVSSAIITAVDNAKQSIHSIYHKATSSSRKTLYSEVLLACAMAKTDELGFFASTDVRKPLSRIMGKPYDVNAFSRHLNEFCENERGNVLQKTGVPRRFRFRFTNSLMQPFIIMQGIASGMIVLDQVSL